MATTRSRRAWRERRVNPWKPQASPGCLPPSTAAASRRRFSRCVKPRVRASHPCPGRRRIARIGASRTWRRSSRRRSSCRRRRRAPTATACQGASCRHHAARLHQRALRELAVHAAPGASRRPGRFARQCESGSRPQVARADRRLPRSPVHRVEYELRQRRRHRRRAERDPRRATDRNYLPVAAGADAVRRPSAHADRRRQELPGDRRRTAISPRAKALPSPMRSPKSCSWNTPTWTT